MLSSAPYRGLLTAAASALALVAALQPSMLVAQDSLGELSVEEQQVVDLLESFETGAEEPVAVISPDQYIQHNLSAPDGLEGFLGLRAALPPGAIKVNTVRVFQDGDYVVAHSDYDFGGPTIGFDVYRFENGQIVEHWDNLQQTAGPNPSGHTMINGPTVPTDLELTEENKALVSAFVDDILVNGRMEKLGDYIDGENYIQHNPQIGDGISGLTAAFEAMAEAGLSVTYDTVHMVLGEGNFVLAMSEGTYAGEPTAFYDLFRVENGRIAEHWDTIETIPPESEWANQNGKF